MRNGPAFENEVLIGFASFGALLRVILRNKAGKMYISARSTTLENNLYKISKKYRKLLKNTIKPIVLIVNPV